MEQRRIRSCLFIDESKPEDKQRKTTAAIHSASCIYTSTLRPLFPTPDGFEVYVHLKPSPGVRTP